MMRFRLIIVKRWQLDWLIMLLMKEIRRLLRVKKLAKKLNRLRKSLIKHFKRETKLSRAKKEAKILLKKQFLGINRPILKWMSL
jgi:transcriptional regulator GlxA family with amidase domain